MFPYSLLLPLTMLLPALWIAVSPWCNARAQDRVALVCSWANLFVLVYIGSFFDAGSPDVQVLSAYEWVPRAGIRLLLGLDGFNLAGLIALSCAFVITYVITIDKLTRGQLLGLSLVHAGSLGFLLAFDVAFAACSLQVVVWGCVFCVSAGASKEAQKVTGRWWAVLQLSGVFFLAGGSVLASLHFSIFEDLSFSLFDLYRVANGHQTLIIPLSLFAFCLACFGMIWPLHRWGWRLGDKSTVLSVFLLQGILPTLAVYGFLRFVIPFLPSGFVSAALPYSVALVLFPGLVSLTGVSDGSRLSLLSSAVSGGAIFSFVLGLSYSSQEVFAIGMMVIFLKAPVFCALCLIGEGRRSPHSSAAEWVWMIVPVLLTITVFVGFPGSPSLAGVGGAVLRLAVERPVLAFFVTSSIGVICVSWTRFLFELSRSSFRFRRRETLSLMGIGLVLISWCFLKVPLGEANRSIEHLLKNQDYYQLFATSADR